MAKYLSYSDEVPLRGSCDQAVRIFDALAWYLT